MKKGLFALPVLATAAAIAANAPGFIMGATHDKAVDIGGDDGVSALLGGVPPERNGPVAADHQPHLVDRIGGLLCRLLLRGDI